MSIITNDIKNGGIYFTPTDLAEFIANSVINNPQSKILDPCYGHGSLLHSAYKRLSNLGCTEPRKQLFGCDIIRPPDTVFSSLDIDRENLVEGDFFKLDNNQLSTKFDVIIMNPPFVRHHLIPDDTKKQLHKLTSDILKLPKTADQWAYFIIHSLTYINHGGSLAAILPWSFLHSDYSQQIRKHLINNFKSIKIVSIGERLFDKTQERILVLLVEGYGTSLIEIKTAYSLKIPNNDIKWVSVKPSSILESPDKEFTAIDEHEYLNELNTRAGFQPLGNFADIKIGTVTGANGFFLLDIKSALKLGIKDSWKKPIIAKAQDISKNLKVHQRDIQHVLLTIPENETLPASLRSYIKTGEKSGLEKRYHNKNRNKWYSLQPKKPPDAFLPYMIKEIPIIVLNPDKVLCTNNIHGVYFHNHCTIAMIRWIQLSMLSSISQLSIEMSSRTYGSGVLKIEPSAALEILVFPGNGYAYPEEIIKKVRTLIQSSRREQAMKLVDDWILRTLHISRKEMDDIVKYYRNLKTIRLGIE